MISITDFKMIVIDIVAAMAEKVRNAEEGTKNLFQNRTNIYRCEDGRPICYCCLRVGHVAKYCWDRRYSCPHASVMKPFQQEPSPPHAFVDVQSLGRDVDKLVKELQRITKDLELSRTTPFRAEDIPTEPEYHADEKDKAQCAEVGPQVVNYCSMGWPQRRFFFNSECQPTWSTRDISSAIYNRDVT